LNVPKLYKACRLLGKIHDFRRLEAPTPLNTEYVASRFPTILRKIPQAQCCISYPKVPGMSVWKRCGPHLSTSVELHSTTLHSCGAPSPQLSTAVDRASHKSSQLCSGGSISPHLLFLLVSAASPTVVGMLFTSHQNFGYGKGGEL